MPEHSGVVSLLGDGHGNEGLGTMHDALRPPERSGALRLIDITPFVDPDVADPAARSQVSAEVDDAARTAGFMQVVGHGVARPVVDDLLAAMEAFFALEPDVKAAYRCPPGINRGYTPPRSEALANSLGLAGAADLLEAFNWAPPRHGSPDEIFLPRPTLRTPTRQRSRTSSGPR
jgi:isopenicillin N synthase-like dioxygenase